MFICLFINRCNFGDLSFQMHFNNLVNPEDAFLKKKNPTMNKNKTIGVFRKHTESSERKTS